MSRDNTQPAGAADKQPQRTAGIALISYGIVSLELGKLITGLQ